VSLVCPAKSGEPVSSVSLVKSFSELIAPDMAVAMNFEVGRLNKLCRCTRTGGGIG